MRVAWIGLGVMGYPMAGHLVTRGGLDVSVYNRTSAKAAKWVEAFKGKSAPTPAEVAKDADIVFANEKEVLAAGAVIEKDANLAVLPPVCGG